MTHQETKREAAVRLAKEAGVIGLEHTMLNAVPILEVFERLIELAKAEQREADIALVEAEHLVDPTDSADDIAYNNAVGDCAAAIRSAAMEAGKKA